MRFALTDDQAALREAVRELLAHQCPPAVVRAAWPGGDRRLVDRLWSQLAGLGLPGAAVPDRLGGTGLSDVDLAPLVVELGYAAAPVPMAETAAVAGPLLAAAGDPGGQLAGLVSGRLRVALVGPTGLAPYGRHADLLLAAGRSRAVLAERPATATAVSTIDGSRDALRVADLAQLTEPAGTLVTTDPGLLALTRDRAALATAAQLIGLGQRLCDLTVDYVRTRTQFGAPVGSFQAVGHQLADLALRLALAQPAVLAAAWSVDRSVGRSVDRSVDRSVAHPAGDRHWEREREREVAMAGLLATEAATVAARTALQCHGAIGYTVEHDLHLYAKRVWALAAAGPDIDHHVTRIAAALGLPEPSGKETPDG